MKETHEKDIMQEIDKKDGFLLVLFSTPFWGKCEIAERFLEEILPQLPEFPAYKSVVDYSPNIVEKYEVSSAPSFKLFVDGEVVQTLFGMRSPDDLYYTLSNYVKKDESSYGDLWADLIEETEKKD